MTITITFNAGNASDAKVLHDLARLLALKPLGVGLQEVADRRALLAKAAKEAGYAHIQRPGGTKGHVALLIRTDANPHNDRLHQIGKRTHVGTDVAGARQTGWTAAKYVLACDVTDPDTGEDLTIATMHLVPSASHSHAASVLLATQAANAAKWLAAQSLPTDLMGDCNGRAGRHEFAPLRKVATALSAPSRKGAAIDIHWVRGGTGKATALDGYSSDHKPVVADITWAPKPKPAPKPEAPVSKAKQQFIPTPPFVAARWHGGKQTPKAIVLHGTVSPDNPGTARAIARFFAHEDGKTSAHYIVDPEQVIQAVGDHTVAYHCGYNQDSIAVELCDEETGPASRWQDADSQAIIARAAGLVAQLCLAYGIEIVRPSVADLKRRGPHGIYGHNDSRLAFGHTTHTDPRDFPWDDFMRKVRAAAHALQAGTAPALDQSQEDDMQLTDKIHPDDPDSPTVADVLWSQDKLRYRTDARLKQIIGMLDPDPLSDEIAAKVNVKAGVTADQVKQAVKDALREGVGES